MSVVGQRQGYGDTRVHVVVDMNGVADVCVHRTMIECVNPVVCGERARLRGEKGDMADILDLMGSRESRRTVNGNVSA